jgi:hypothetical protein
MVDEAIVTDRDIGNGDNDGYAFNFAFIAGIYVINQLAVDDAMSAQRTLATLMGRINNHRIRDISTTFYLYAISRYAGINSIAWDTSENKFKVQSFSLGRLSTLQERYIRVGNAATLNSHTDLNSFIFFILKCLGGMYDHIPKAQYSAYIGAFTQENFNKFCKALLSGNTEIWLPIPSPDGSSVETRSIITPKAPDSNSVLYKVLTCLMPTKEIAEVPASTKENHVKWWIIAIIAASILVSGFGFFMSFTSYIAFSAINIVAPLIAALGLAAAIALPVGIAIKKYCDHPCCSKLYAKLHNRSVDEEPPLSGSNKDI